jgi:D-beta-D-heptose 7-phosphate kinase/D-beta-D-heptose 1-phosphate adenosyltransferase
VAVSLTADLPTRIAERRPIVLVVGDAILDGWLSGECHRLAREAPAPVLDVTARRFVPGGAANTAVNLAALGADARFVAVVGDDREGELLREKLDAAGVDTSGLLTVPGRATMCKRRLVAGAQLLARLDDGDGQPVAAEFAPRLHAALRRATAGVDALLVCDYRLGLLDEPLREVLDELRPDLPIVAVDAHDVGRWAGLRPDFVTPNLEETTRLLGRRLPEAVEDRLAVLQDSQPALHTATGADAVLVTMDRDGSLLLREGRPPHRTWAEPAPDNQTAGAGDTYLAAVCLARTLELPMTTAVELGQAAADVVVHQGGTAVCGTAELAERLDRFRTAALAPDQLAARLAGERSAGRRIVFTNGCFDVLHPGHVGYLNQAKRMGDVLVVAVNSDASVRRLKGPGRPVNTAEDRAAVLAALSCVDYVTVFDGPNAIGLLDRLRPEVYAKGGDYTPDMLPETDTVRGYGGEVRILDYLPDRSTTAVIDRIKALG